jgi:hypothetical protein
MIDRSILLTLPRGELLELLVDNEPLQQELLLVAVVSAAADNSGNQVLARGSLPVSGLVPGQPCSVAAELSDGYRLYATLLMVDAGSNLSCAHTHSHTA